MNTPIYKPFYTGIITLLLMTNVSADESCENIHQNYERAYCFAVKLYSSDQGLNENYNILRNCLNDQQKKALAAKQSQWLHDRQVKCTKNKMLDIECSYHLNNIRMDFFSDQLIQCSKAKLVSIQTEIKRINKKLADLGLYWADAGSKNSLPICQSVFEKGYQIGHYRDNQCWISYGGVALQMQKFQVLTGNQDKITWRPFSDADQTHLVAAGVEHIVGVRNAFGPMDRILYPCRVNFEGRSYIGKIVDNACNIAVDNQEIRIDEDAEVLVIRE